MADFNSSCQRIARGVARHLSRLNFASLEEFVPTRGLRVDLMAIGPKSEIWIIECKSGRADFMADKKWQGYLDYCDSFFWAVDMQFPTNILPDESGLIIRILSHCGLTLNDPQVIQAAQNEEMSNIQQENA